jgi:arylformamidase
MQVQGGKELHMNVQKLYDITPAITPSLAVWPGDTRVSREVLFDMNRGDNITLSTLRATVHLGAHADGPNHYGQSAPSIDQRDLNLYLGKCQLVRAETKPAQRVQIADLKSQIEIGIERVLIATNTYRDPWNFTEDFAALDPKLVDDLHRRGVRLIGIDTPSVDLFDSKDLPAHKRFLANDMAILEGLMLSEVPEGIYELIALPLKLAGFDASPVRAILRTLVK